MERHCKTCGTTKAIEEFVKKADKPFGRGYICLACDAAKAKVRMARIREADPAAHAEYVREWRAKNPERHRQIRRRKQAFENGKRRQVVIERRRAALMAEMQFGPPKSVRIKGLKVQRPPLSRFPWQAGHADFVQGKVWSVADKYRWKYANDPEFAVKERVRNMMSKHAKRYAWVAHRLAATLKAGGASRLWDLLGYDAATLRRHLERQFTKGMTWEIFLAGQIHIDHIRPKSLFALDTVEDVRACYCLSNLRPLWAVDNIRKHARLEMLC